MGHRHRVAPGALTFTASKRLQSDREQPMSSTSKPTILTCAVTGNFPTRQHNPNLPVTPQEIAEACIGAAKAGAAVCHIHVREPSTGLPSRKLDY